MNKTNRSTVWVLVLSAVAFSSCGVPKQGVKSLVDFVLAVCEDKQDPTQADIEDCFQQVRQAQVEAEMVKQQDAGVQQ